MNFNDAVAGAIRQKAEEQDSMLRLMVSIDANHVDVHFIMEEVDRRDEVFKNHWKLGIRGHLKTARCAAIDSVYNDVCRGYLA